MKTGRMNTDLPLGSLCASAVEAALKAGELIASYRDKQVEVLTKEGGDNLASSVVTEVDLKSQEIILNTLEPVSRYYDLGLLTEEEEDDFSRFEKEAFWCIDPIDGTLPFTESVPGYAVSIGLVSREGHPLAGVVYDPLSSTLYSGIKGQGAFRNRIPWYISSENVIKTGKSLTWVTDRDQEDLPFYTKLTASLEAEALKAGLKGLDMIHQGGAVLNACWCMENSPALYFKIPKTQKGGGCFWDFAATACLVEEAGGVVVDFSGNPLNLNAESPYMNEKGVLFLSSPGLIDLREILQDFNPLI